jgi:voltage-gated potassium channel
MAQRSGPYRIQRPRRAWHRELRAGLRDTFLLVREFQGALALFVVTAVVGGVSFKWLSEVAGEGYRVGYIEAIYDVLTMVFFQPNIPFPDRWYLQAYFFVMPALGLAILARGAADFGLLLFNRQSRQAQWEEAVAATFRDHVVVCGLGHLGIRVVRELVALGEEVVAIDLDPNPERAEEARSYDIPVIVGDARRTDTLKKAGLAVAEAAVICTNDDLMNLQIALAARDVRTDIRLVVRMFSDEFARQMAEQFGFDAVFSASALAAPAFAGAATQTEITQSLYVEGELMNMGRVIIRNGSGLDGAIVGDLEREFDMSVVLHQRDQHVDVHPVPDVRLAGGDLVMVFASLPVLARLSEQNRCPNESR